MKQTTTYVIVFTLILTSVTAVVLAGLFYATRDTAKANELVFNKRAILQSIEEVAGFSVAELTDEQVNSLFSEKVDQYALNANGEQVEGVMAEGLDMAVERKKPLEERTFPLFVYKNADKAYYIMSVRGSGLWDEIWGNIAIANDFSTIVGATFDHKGETPGLGAEIKDNPAFAAQFTGKQLYNEQGEYTSVIVRKGGAQNPRNEVDGITGATITADGVTEMMVRGIKYYEPYFDGIKGNSKQESLLIQ